MGFDGGQCEADSWGSPRLISPLSLYIRTVSHSVVVSNVFALLSDGSRVTCGNDDDEMGDSRRFVSSGHRKIDVATFSQLDALRSKPLRGSTYVYTVYDVGQMRPKAKRVEKVLAKNAFLSSLTKKKKLQRTVSSSIVRCETTIKWLQQREKVDLRKSPKRVFSANEGKERFIHVQNTAKSEECKKWYLFSLGTNKSAHFLSESKQRNDRIFWRLYLNPFFASFNMYEKEQTATDFLHSKTTVEFEKHTHTISKSVKVDGNKWINHCLSWKRSAWEKKRNSFLHTNDEEKRIAMCLCIVIRRCDDHHDDDIQDEKSIRLAHVRTFQRLFNNPSFCLSSPILVTLGKRQLPIDIKSNNTPSTFSRNEFVCYDV